MRRRAGPPAGVRQAAIVLGAVLVAALAALQLLGSLALRNRAAAGSWLRLIPPAVAARVEELPPGLPLPSALRLVLARRALEDGKFALAARRIARLPPSRDRAALEGALAEARGNVPAAAAAYLTAGDLAGVERLVARTERRGDIGAALALQQRVVGRLSADSTQRDALAEAYYRLGLLDQDAAYQLGVGDPRRHAAEVRAQAAYDRAVALAPLSLRYLIAAGSQRLNLGDLDAASRDFTSARAADPTSAVALAGLGEVALRRRDAAGARAWLAAARALDRAEPAVQRLAHELGR